MPSSLICCLEDSSYELEHLQIKSQGEKIHSKQDDCFDEALFPSISTLVSFKVSSVAAACFSRVFPPANAALSSCKDVVESAPNLEPFGPEYFPFSGILRYFLDLKTPASAGSAAAHQIYRPKQHVI